MGCDKIRGLTPGIEPFDPNHADQIPEPVLSCNTTANVKERCLLRNLAARIDQNAAQLSLVLLPRLRSEPEPIIYGTTPRNFFRCPPSLGPAPLEINAFLS